MGDIEISELESWHVRTSLQLSAVYDFLTLIYLLIFYINTFMPFHHVSEFNHCITSVLLAMNRVSLHTQIGINWAMVPLDKTAFIELYNNLP